MTKTLAASALVALVAAGTTARQAVCLATLGDLPERAAAADLPAPCLIIIGRVVALAPTLAPPAAAEELLEAADA